MNGTARNIVLGTSMLACIGCDRVTKQLAVERLEPDRPQYLYWNDTVRIQYAENFGAFLGLGGDWPDWVRFWLLTAATSVLLVFVVWHLVRTPNLGTLRSLALAMILAGGIGNLWDRIVDGYVVDFMNLGIGSLRTGIFNVADVAITGGVIALVVLGLGPNEDKEPEAAVPAGPGGPEGPAPEGDG